jgi:hypothetical protein
MNQKNHIFLPVRRAIRRGKETEKYRKMKRQIHFPETHTGFRTFLCGPEKIGCGATRLLELFNEEEIYCSDALSPALWRVFL